MKMEMLLFVAVIIIIQVVNCAVPSRTESAVETTDSSQCRVSSKDLLAAAESAARGVVQGICNPSMEHIIIYNELNSKLVKNEELHDWDLKFRK